MQLRHINIRALIAEAGGDPWAIEHSLHAGRPAQIAELAEAFHAAGRCTAEANAAFEEARRRFEASWNRENGEHPINDSAEVQRVTAALGVQSLQLPKIGVDLENIAADLAEAQRAAAGRIATLESQLQRIDDQLDQALELEHDPRLAAAERSELDALITCLEQDAIDDTASALGQLQSIRAGYSDHLQQSLAMLRADGYDGAGLQGLDAPQSPVKPEEPIQIPPPGTGASERDSRSPRVTTKAIRLIRAPSGWPFCCRAITTRTFSTSVPPCCRTAGSTAPHRDSTSTA